MFSRMVCMMLYKFPLHDIYIYIFNGYTILVHLFVCRLEMMRNGTPVVATQPDLKKTVRAPKGHCPKSVSCILRAVSISFLEPVVIPNHFVLKGNITRNVIFLSTNKNSSIK